MIDHLSESSRTLVDLKLNNFHRDWGLRSEWIFCVHCGAAQSASSADKPFQHEPYPLAECQSRGTVLVDYPWRTLQELLMEAPTNMSDDGARWRKFKKAGPVAAGWFALTPNSKRWDEAIDKHLDLRAGEHKELPQ